MRSSPMLNAICRGLVGHVSYLATCSLSDVYSEYLLYEAIARVAQSKGFRVRCEVPVGPKRTGPGDYPRIDFRLIKGQRSIALEVKWCRTKTCDVTKDVRKLTESKSDERFLLTFGRGKTIETIKIKSGGSLLRPRGKGKLVRWNAGKTDYAARWYGV